MLLTVMLFVLKSIEVCFNNFHFFTSVPNLLCTSKLNFFDDAEAATHRCSKEKVF